MPRYNLHLYEVTPNEYRKGISIDDDIIVVTKDKVYNDLEAGEFFYIKTETPYDGFLELWHKYTPTRNPVVIIRLSSIKSIEEKDGIKTITL